jgi:Integrase core domain
MADRSRSPWITALSSPSRALDEWAYRRGVALDFIRPGKPVDNGYIESFNGKLRDECLNAHQFLSIADARSKIEAWHSRCSLRTPASLAPGQAFPLWPWIVMLVLAVWSLAIWPRAEPNHYPNHPWSAEQEGATGKSGETLLMIDLIKDPWEFMRHRKKFWLIAQGSAVAPFIYTLF